MPYQLPSDPDIPSQDPLGICDHDSPTQCQVLDKFLANAYLELRTVGTSILPPLLENIAYSIHGNGSLDTGYLRDILSRGSHIEAVANMLDAAANLQEQFLSHTLPLLQEVRTIIYTGKQINALLAHQFLGTLSQPKGNDWGLPCFTSWFRANPTQRQVVDGYIAILLDHFSNGGYPEDAQFRFTLQKTNILPDFSQRSTQPDIQLHIITEEFEPSNTNSDASPFVLVACHPQPGPGPTATQEERLQAASPALSISALSIPILPADAAVVTSPFPVHASWRGHNRTAHSDTIFKPIDRPSRHYILADALQLDEVEDDASTGLKDLQLDHVQREIRKLYAAFSGAIAVQEATGQGEGKQCVIEAGAWGCGAFGGNIVVKAICMMIAASIAGVALRMTLIEHRKEEIGAVKRILEKKYSVAELWNRITSPGARACKDTQEITEYFLG